MKTQGKSGLTQDNSALFDIGERAIRWKERLTTAFFRVKHRTFHDRMESISQKSQYFLEEIKSLGFTRTMDELDRGSCVYLTS